MIWRGGRASPQHDREDVGARPRHHYQHHRARWAVADAAGDVPAYDPIIGKHYVTPDGDTLDHPLVRCDLRFKRTIAIANETYETKTRQITEAIDKQDWMLFDSVGRWCPQREKRKLILGWGNVGVPRCATTAFTT